MNTSAWNKEFSDRFRRREAELTRLYLQLYHGDGAAFDRFVDMLFDAYTARPEPLKAMDRVRETDPGWYRGHSLVGMLLYVKGFAGTLQGVREKLSYIEDCGVNCLHLMPLLESPADRSDGGYAVSDYRKVQRSLGTMEDLVALAEDCHGRGISLCLDFVMNHTSEDHEWARRARAGEKAYQDRYFLYDGWDLPNAYEQTMPQVFPTTAPGNFTWCPEAGKLVMTTFHPYQWDLNYANPAVFHDMTDNMLFLCNQGIDVVRLDAVPYLWKALGTSCRNLPQVHVLVRMLRMVTEIVCPGTLLLGEVVMEPDKVAPYFGSMESPECHLLYNVTTMATLWHTAATSDVRLLRHQMEQMFSLPREHTFLNYLRCHDDIGWGLDFDFLRRLGVEEVSHKRFLNDYFAGHYPRSTARGELYNDDPRLMDARLCGTTASLSGIEAARQRRDGAALEKAVRLDLMLHAFLFTLSGVPVLYSGDEVGRENDYSYHRDPLKAADSRYVHRGAMDWALAEARTDESTAAGQLFQGIQRMEALRATHPVFDGRADTWLLDTGCDAVLGIGRYYRRQKLLAVFNFSQEEQIAWLKEREAYVDLLTGAPQDARMLTLPAGSFAWLIREYR